MATLLVANAGGHLHELWELLPRIGGIDLDAPTWVTFDTAQSRSLLAGADVVFAPYPRPRDPVVTLRHAVLAHRLLRRRRYENVISTGSSIAVAFLPEARLMGSACHYIESATRLAGPSLTGRILARTPGIHVYSQVPGWPEPPWHVRGSVFDGYRAEDSAQLPPRLRRVVVAVGSSESYGFPRLIEKMAEILPPDADVLWQTGSTDLQGLTVAARPRVPHDELAQAIAEADLVVTHAGVGLSLLALSNGRCPVVVPRRRHRGEHVDDHQVQVAAMLAERNLAVACEVEDLSLQVLEKASVRLVVRVDSPRFELEVDRRRTR